MIVEIDTNELRELLDMCLDVMNNSIIDPSIDFGPAYGLSVTKKKELEKRLKHINKKIKSFGK